MRRCVFLAVLLTLVLSLLKESTSETDSATTLTITTDTTGSSSDTSPTPNLTTTIETTESTSETDSTPSSPTSTETPGSSSDTSPIPNLTTTTETTGSSSDSSPTPNLTTITETTDSPDRLSDTSHTTISTDAEGQNVTEPTTTATNTTGESDTTAMTTAPGTTGQNVTEPTTTATNTTGESDTTAMTTAPGTTGQNVTEPTTTATNTTGQNVTEPTTAATNTTGKNDITTTTPTMTTAGTTGDFCNPDPCGTTLATCVRLNSTFNCLCQYGFYYKDNDCHRGKIFPGVITLSGTYDDSVLIVNSAQYEEVLNNLTAFFKYAFENLTGYEQTVIVEIQLVTKNRASPEIRVTLINLFMENTTANNETVSSAVMNATNYFTSDFEYTGTTYCAVYNCDANTTVCEEDEFPRCTCKDGFSKAEWDTLSCSGCSKNCYERENMYCAKENGVPVCTCISDFEDKGGKCVPCSVGYSGEKCENNSELILIIVGTVLGAAVLCLAIAITVVSIRAKHKQDPEKKTLLRSGYSNPNTFEDRQPTMFPRVRTTTGHANPGYQPNNPYEMRDFDDLYEVSREPEGFRIHSRN